MSYFGELTINLRETKSTQSASTVSASTSKKQNSINEQKVGKNIDAGDFGHTNPASAKNVKTSEDREIGQITLNIQKICERDNIDYKKLMTNLYTVTGKTKEEFQNLDKETQRTLLLYVEEAIALSEKAPNDVNKIEAVKAETELVWDAIDNKTFKDRKDIKEFDAKIGVSAEVKELIDNSENLTLEEINARSQVIDKKLQKRYEQECASIEKLPKEQRVAAKKLLDERHKFARRKIFYETMISTDSKKGLAVMSIVHSEDLGNAAEDFLGTRIDDAKRKMVADKSVHNYAHFTNCVKAAQARGEDITSNEALASFEKYNTEFVSWKDINSSIDYDFDAVRARHDKNIPNIVYKAVAKGIGIGAFANHVMDSVEKEAFIKCWINSNKDFLTEAEIAQVIEDAKIYVQEYQINHPETKCAEVREGKILAQEILKRPLNSNPEAQTQIMQNAHCKFSNKKGLNQKITTAFTQKEKTLSPSEKDGIKKDFICGNITIEEVLEKVSITELCKDPAVRATKKDVIANHIRKIFDLNILETLATQCGMINDVVTNYRGNKKEELYALIKRNATYNQRVEMRKLKNAAA